MQHEKYVVCFVLIQFPTSFLGFVFQSNTARSCITPKGHKLKTIACKQVFEIKIWDQKFRIINSHISDFDHCASLHSGFIFFQVASFNSISHAIFENHRIINHKQSLLPLKEFRNPCWYSSLESRLVIVIVIRIMSIFPIVLKLSWNIITVYNIILYL
jgi:hypothetical protein